MIFDIKNSLWKSNFDTSRRGRKAFQDAYYQGGWLILQVLLNNWVAEGVASEVNDWRNFARRDESKIYHSSHSTWD